MEVPIFPRGQVPSAVSPRWRHKNTQWAFATGRTRSCCRLCSLCRWASLLPGAGRPGPGLRWLRADGPSHLERKRDECLNPTGTSSAAMQSPGSAWRTKPKPGPTMTRHVWTRQAEDLKTLNSAAFPVDQKHLWLIIWANKWKFLLS